jgi:hypothetical protein
MENEDTNDGKSKRVLDTVLSQFLDFLLKNLRETIKISKAYDKKAKDYFAYFIINFNYSQLEAFLGRESLAIQALFEANEILPHKLTVSSDTELLQHFLKTHDIRIELFESIVATERFDFDRLITNFRCH